MSSHFTACSFHSRGTKGIRGDQSAGGPKTSCKDLFSIKVSPIFNINEAFLKNPKIYLYKKSDFNQRD